MKLVLVDDEAPARSLLREYLAEHPQIEVVAECSNGFQAVKAVSRHRPDLLLLDIQMPKLSGFEVLELLDFEPAVIFTTAYDEHAVRAFEVHAVDYLLKPFSAQRFADALERAAARLAENRPQPLQELAAAAAQRDGTRHRVLIRDGSKIHVLAPQEIDFVEAQGDYLSFHCGTDAFSKQQTLRQLEKELDPESFLRIHRSYLLNLDRLDRIELYAKDSRVAILKDGRRLPLSRTGYGRLRELL